MNIGKDNILSLHFFKKYFIILALFLNGSAAFSANDATLKRLAFPELNQTVSVTPGQQFYSDTYLKPVTGYRLDRTFKSSMGGAYGFPFSFSIDELILIPSGTSKDGSWQYFVPKGKKFTASHGLLGSVISGGDTVGLRIHQSGKREWFVDNSVHNGYPTIWSRKVKDKDPVLTRIENIDDEPSGLPLYQLIYLGLDGRQARVRLETLTPTDTVRDEFKFELNDKNQTSIYINGGQFDLVIEGPSAKITIIKHMAGQFAKPND